MIHAILTYVVDGQTVELVDHADDPQDALNWLWVQAEQAPEDATDLKATIDGKPVTL